MRDLREKLRYQFTSNFRERTGTLSKPLLPGSAQGAGYLVQRTGWPAVVRLRRKNGKTIAGEIFGTDGQHKNTKEVLC